MKSIENPENTKSRFPLSDRKPKILVLVIIGLISIIILFNIVSLFSPFATFPTTTKLAILVFGFIIFFVLLLIFYRNILHKKIQEQSQKWWKHFLIAIVFATVIFLTTYSHSPLYPTTISIQIKTTSSLEFFHSNKRLSNDKVGYIYDYDQTSGEWNTVDGVFIFEGGEIGELTYEGMEFVNKDTRLIFTFLPQDKPTKARITINENVYDIRIPSAQDVTGNYDFSITFHELTPSTKLWQVWLVTFPLMRWLFLSIYFFFALFLIGPSKKHDRCAFFHLCFLFIVSFLFYNAILFQNDLVNYFTFNFLWALIAIIAFLLFPFIITLIINKYPKSKPWIILSIFLIAIGLRFYWIKMVPSAQVSDFGKFHRWALQLASGEGGISIDRHSTFTRLVGLIYKIIPSHEIIELLNIVFSLVTMFSIWQIGKSINQEKAGIIGAYFFGIFPSQISMVTIVCADIIAVGLLSLSLLFLILSVNNNKYAFLLLSAIIYGLSVAIRSPLIAYAPVFLVPLLINSKLKTSRKYFIRIILIIIGAAIGFLSVKGISQTIQVDNKVIHERRSLYKTLLHGTNIDHRGRNNSEDIALIQSWNEDELLQKVINTMFKRLREDPIGFMRILKYKYAYMFGDGTYGASTAFLGEDVNFQTFETHWPYATSDIRNAFALLSQYSYWVILGLAALLPFTHIKPIEKSAVLITLIIILSALIFYTFFEVQPRYQRPIIPSVVFLASLSFVKIKDSF